MPPEEVKNTRLLSRSSIVTLVVTLVAIPVTIFMSMSRQEVRQHAQVSSTARPNIIAIIADDLDVKTLNLALKNKFMPNLQKYIISKGSSFTRFFVTNSLCCPSRATFLTGQYSHNHGVYTNESTSHGAIGAFNDSSTIATWLHAAGYRTGYVGKYLNGYGDSDLNNDGVINDIDKKYVPPGWDDWQVLVDPTTYKVYNYTINDNRNLVSYGSDPSAYQTDVLASRSADFITESHSLNGAAPFFLVVTPLAPHLEVDPLTFVNGQQYSDLWRWTIRPAPRHVGTVDEKLPYSPSFNEDDVSDKPLELQQNRPLLALSDIVAVQSQFKDRLTSLRAVDDLIGTIVATLIENGELDTTVLMFTSDNGFMYGEHRLSEKLYPYEESIRVPLYVASPGFSPVQEIAMFVANNDLAPSIAEFANVTPGVAVDGTSFVGLMQSPNTSWRKRFLIEHWNAGGIFDVSSFAAVRTAPDSTVAPAQLYVEYQDSNGSKEHYSFSIDPYQKQSMHNDSVALHMSQRQQLTQWLSSLKTCQGTSCHSTEFSD